MNERLDFEDGAYLGIYRETSALRETFRPSSRAPALPVTIMLASSPCSGRSGSCSRTRSGRSGMNCDFSSGICADDDVLDALRRDQERAHSRSRRARDAQERHASMKAALFRLTSKLLLARNLFQQNIVAQVIETTCNPSRHTCAVHPSLHQPSETHAKDSHGSPPWELTREPSHAPQPFLLPPAWCARAHLPAQG